MPSAVDLTGQKFNRLTALTKTDKRTSGSVMWRCQCDCGNFVIVGAAHLKTGNTKSCGCLNLERITERNTKHGANISNDLVHPLYKVWHNMKQRCDNPKNPQYKDYGGRGIKYCKEWSDFIPFRDYMLLLPGCPKEAQTPGSRLDKTIDRIRNNEGYRPGNVRWATRKQQMNNMRSNRIVKINGIYMALPEAVEKYAKVSYSAVRSRLRYGWTVRDAFLKPKQGSVV